MTPRASAPRGPVALILTGGQTGVDRAATDVAIELHVPYGGWVPAGGRAEDAPHAPGVLARYPCFCDSGAADPAVRTRRNVAEADAVLVLAGGDDLAGGSPGTTLALAHARHLGRVLAVVDPLDPAAGARLADLAARLAPRSALNVVGPREGERPGAYATARRLLEAAGAVLLDVGGL